MISKVELRKQLKNLGITVQGTFVKRSDIQKVLSEEGYNRKILQGYFEAMLWSSRNIDVEDEEFLDENYSILDISEELTKQSLKDIEDFVTKADEAEIQLTLYDTETIGHDFWLSRSGSGAGFNDGDYEGNDGEDGETLHKIASSFKEVNPYVGDDGKIYAE